MGIFFIICKIPDQIICGKELCCVQTLDPVIICKHWRTDVPHLNDVFLFLFVKSTFGRVVKDEFYPISLWGALFQELGVQSYDTHFSREMTPNTMSLSWLISYFLPVRSKENILQMAKENYQHNMNSGILTSILLIIYITSCNTSQHQRICH